MVKLTCAIVLGVLFCTCAEPKILLANTEVKSSAIRFNSLYLYPFYSRNYTRDTPDSLAKDSSLNFNGFVFFRNGILRRHGFGEGQLNTPFIGKLLTEVEKFRDNWGVYEIRNDTITIKGWDAGPGIRVYEQVAKIVNQDELRIFKTRCFSCSKWEVGYKWEYEVESYKYDPVIIVADSTTDFIKPLKQAE